MTVVGLLIVMQLSGMMLANVPAVYLGEELVKRVPLHVMRWIAAVLFLALGAWQIWALVVA